MRYLGAGYLSSFLALGYVWIPGHASAERPPEKCDAHRDRYSSVGELVTSCSALLKPRLGIQCWHHSGAHWQLQRRQWHAGQRLANTQRQGCRGIGGVRSGAAPASLVHPLAMALCPCVPQSKYLVQQLRGTQPVVAMEAAPLVHATCLQHECPPHLRRGLGTAGGQGLHGSRGFFQCGRNVRHRHGNAAGSHHAAGCRDCRLQAWHTRRAARHAAPRTNQRRPAVVTGWVGPASKVHINMGMLIGSLQCSQQLI